ncbi:MAG: 16S rRNA (cytosine(1402)-N(4))-methyltransferase RsmH [Pseudomonadota bacterium]
MTSIEQHIPVLTREAILALQVRKSGAYLDATFGRGGHSAKIIEELGVEGSLVAFDRDPTAIEQAQTRYADDDRVSIHHADFAQIRKLVAADGSIDGVLMDLGVSSPQLDDAERGFSFMRDGPLDMRMDTSKGESARDWLARVAESDLVKVLFELGEERFARRIARAIITARDAAPLASTLELAAIVESATPKKDRHKHPATRTFQAIRLHVNQELEQISAALPEAVRLMAPKARLVIISFHSLEDRIVKRFMRNYAKPKLPPIQVPTTERDYETPLRLIGKAQKPTAAEIDQNPRSRSSVLRVAERTEMDVARLSEWEATHA